jgi:hypothetical protein
MSHIQPAFANGGLWRVLLLSRDPSDPLWAIASITLAEDVIPAQLDRAGRYQNWSRVCRWTGDRLGLHIELEPIHDALAWSIRRGR